MRIDGIVASLAVFAFATVVAGCAGDLDDESKFTDGGTSGFTCTDAVKDVFAKSCVTGCHSSSAAASSGNLDLETTGIAARLVGKKAAGGPGMLIDSSNVESSVMLTKLKNPPPFGARMPFGSAALTDAQTKCVHDWVVAQAGSGSDAGTDSGGAGDAKGD